MAEALADDWDLHEGPIILASMDLHDSQAPPDDLRVSIAHLLAVIRKFNFWLYFWHMRYEVYPKPLSSSLIGNKSIKLHKFDGVLLSYWI